MRTKRLVPTETGLETFAAAFTAGSFNERTFEQEIEVLNVGVPE